MTWTDTYDVLKLYNEKYVGQNKLSLNRHIWCIETVFKIFWARKMSLEPTHMMYWNRYGCYGATSWIILNRHIWCIETLQLLLHCLVANPWTDTYDVLKPHLAHLKGGETILEPTHMMYWNKVTAREKKKLKTLEPTHMMYWNTTRNIINLLKNFLNRHIWCIETKAKQSK